MVGDKALINGVEIYFERVGHGSHPVLLIPGSFGCAETDFHPQLQKLSWEKFTLVCFDPRGYGKSRPPNRDFPPDYLQRDAEDGAALMKHLGFETYSILGWSDGANSACLLTAKWPERIKKLVIWGANSYLTEEDLIPLRVLKDLNNWSDRMKQTMFSLYNEAHFQVMVNKWVEAYEGMWKQIDENGVADMYRSELPKIQCETLIIHGLKDSMVYTYHAEYLNKHIKNSRLECWPDGKHNLHLRFPDTFNKLVEQFLTSPSKL